MSADEGAQGAAGEGERRREEGRGRVGLRFREWVGQARKAAVLHADLHGEVTAEDVRRLCPVPPEVHPSAMGSVFHTDLLTSKGYTKAKHPEGHARAIMVWALTEAGKRWAAAHRPRRDPGLFPGGTQAAPREEEGPPR